MGDGRLWALSSNLALMSNDRDMRMRGLDEEDISTVISHSIKKNVSER